MGFFALAVVVMIPLLALGLDGTTEVINWIFLFAIVGLTTTYLALSARRVYGVGRGRAWAGGLAVATVGFAAVVLGYRVLLFWLTLWTLDLPPA